MHEKTPQPETQTPDIGKSKPHPPAAVMEGAEESAALPAGLAGSISALDDSGLAAVVEFVAAEQARRSEARREEAVRQILEIAQKAGLAVAIEGAGNAAEVVGIKDAGPRTSPPARQPRKDGKQKSGGDGAEAAAAAQEPPGAEGQPGIGDLPGGAPLLYRHPRYKGYPAWPGKGPMPRWLKKELEQGAKLEDFLSRE